MRMPAFFIAHGSPTLIMENNDYTRFLEQLGRDLPRPRGIAVFSAHWDSPEQLVSVDEKHTALHDFYGFPEEMYRLHYDAPGDAALNRAVCDRLDAGQLPYQPVLGRGLDHGIWVILSKMFPEAEIPVVALSVDSMRQPREQYGIGELLAPLREEGVLFIGSGGMVHNLRLLGEEDRPADWAVAFDEWIAERLESWDTPALFDYAARAPHAREAVPSYGREHFVPLFYAMGTAADGRRARRMIQAYQYGTLSLNCWMLD
ncbi:dioxygenase [Paenibacillus spiritus]|uniref:Dioxygenase n=1 Tax=Paenibacillus spiritus TaxID=2496557 RepID=A0A5J5FU19_9BACL|nr:class III extradiol ring-cleavage dioxygenase [Paenibacillus spiritus]KAA8996852.1 dioxygenase [Paenibacillus spiritus]